jgi:hypothetical protein
LPQDDRFYLGELVRRYVPDTLSAYLQVPAGQRNTVVPETSLSASALLDEQLALLQAELIRIEKLLVEGSHEALQQQQRFLSAKHGPR